MLIEVKVPILSESISEATLMNWRKHQGEFVNQDENLVDLETDKVVLEVAAPKSGRISEIRKNDGANVNSDEVIAVIDTDAANDDDSVANANDQAVVPTAAKETIKTESHEKNLNPAVRKLVMENNLDVSYITGTGKNGRITKGDVLKHIESLQHESIQQTAQQSSRKAHDQQSAQPGLLALKPMDIEGRPEQRVPMSRLRARVAERLKEAQNSAAILTTFNEINMQPIMDVRNKYKDQFQEKHSVKLGFMSFFTRAVADALKQFPVINASVDDNYIVYHGYYDIGIAVGSPRGLVVPILRDVDRMSFADIEVGINTYGKKARDGKLSLEELTGGTFSISNGGVYGSMMSTPILNPPQSAILGMHNITERAMVENGQVVVRPMMYLALSYDHRIIDGHEAVLFLVAVKQALEDPTRMLLDI